MNIDDALSDFESRVKNTTKSSGFQPDKVIFVAPSPDVIPDDGVLAYTTIESIFDIKNVPDRSVILIRPDQLEIISCISEHTTIFNIQLATLTGVPNADYSIAFDEATWRFDKVAYAPFISELRIAGEIEEQLAAQKRTLHDEEKLKYTRKTGEVKEHSDFKIERIAPTSKDTLSDDYSESDDELKF